MEALRMDLLEIFSVLVSWVGCGLATPFLFSLSFKLHSLSYITEIHTSFPWTGLKWFS